jgi:hypothetical protein
VCKFNSKKLTTKSCKKITCQACTECVPPSPPLQACSGNVAMNLKGGNMNRATTYNAPDGTTVKSTVETWTNQHYYYLGYLFDGSMNGGDEHTKYWLAKQGASGELTITFPSPRRVSSIKIRPAARSDTWSSFTVAARKDAASDYVALTPSDGIKGHLYRWNGEWSKSVHSADLPEVSQIKIALTNQGPLGVSLDEIMLYTCE